MTCEKTIKRVYDVIDKKFNELEKELNKPMYRLLTKKDWIEHKKLEFAMKVLNDIDYTIKHTISNE